MKYEVVIAALTREARRLQETLTTLEGTPEEAQAPGFDRYKRTLTEAVVEYERAIDLLRNA